ncbi:MAG: class II aldolase/adducin family protein, partial [Gammaproteobacteria bacterium]|nr:class II aldolase/adducin family protein [Gammaproteobacteria bacterium]
MYKELRRKVLKANLDLVKHNLVILTWGNVSMIDRGLNVIAIKPSGVPYDLMKEEDIVICDLNGNVIDGKLKPSTDLHTHIELYKAFKEIGGVCHTHSSYATSFAQARKEIPVLGTTHADYFSTVIPCARELNESEMDEYEKNTGKVIVETF